MVDNNRKREGEKEESIRKEARKRKVKKKERKNTVERKGGRWEERKTI